MNAIFQILTMIVVFAISFMIIMAFGQACESVQDDSKVRYEKAYELSSKHSKLLLLFHQFDSSAMLIGESITEDEFNEMNRLHRLLIAEGDIQ